MTYQVGDTVYIENAVTGCWDPAEVVGFKPAPFGSIFLDVRVPELFYPILLREDQVLSPEEAQLVNATRGIQAG